MRGDILQQDARLAEVVRRLVLAYEPLRIYLFGSVAQGETGPDSDYDLMLIVPDDAPPERLRSRLAYEALRGTGIAADVLVSTRRCTGVHTNCSERLRISAPGSSPASHRIWKPLQIPTTGPPRSPNSRTASMIGAHPAIAPARR